MTYNDMNVKVYGVEATLEILDVFLGGSWKLSVTRKENHLIKQRKNRRTIRTYHDRTGNVIVLMKCIEVLRVIRLIYLKAYFERRHDKQFGFCHFVC